MFGAPGRTLKVAGVKQGGNRRAYLLRVQHSRPERCRCRERASADPDPCGAIRVDLIAKNRLQWLAEALHRYRDGATWGVPSGIADEQEARQQVDPWEDVLRAYMVHGRPTDGADGMGRIAWPEGWISSAEILRDWLRVPAHQQGKA